MSHESIDERVCLWEDEGSAEIWAKPRFFTGGSGATTAPSVEFVIILTRKGKCVCNRLDQFCDGYVDGAWSVPSCEGEGEGDAAVATMSFILKRSRAEGSCAPDEIENQNNCFGSLPPRKFYKRSIYELSEDEIENLLLIMSSAYNDDEEVRQGTQACIDLNTANYSVNWHEAWRCTMNQCQRRQGSSTLDCGNVGRCGLSSELVMNSLGDYGGPIPAAICDMLKYPYRLDCDGGRSSAYVISDSEIDAANRKVLEELDPSFRFQIESYTLL